MVVPDLSPAARAKSLQNWGKFAGGSAFVSHGLSMSEEARNTDRRGFGWSATPLRTQAISFVSAGPLRREEDAWNTVSEDDTSNKKFDAEATNEQTQLAQEEDETIMPEAQESLQPATQIATDPYINTQEEARAKEDDVLVPTIPQITVPPTPPAETVPTTSNASSPPSSDSDEEIVFSGRSGVQLPSRKPTPAPPMDVKKDISPPITASAPPPATLPTTVSQTTTSAPREVDLPTRSLAASAMQADSGSRGDSPFGKKFFSRKYNEDELMQDYIDNMALDDSEQEDDGAIEESAGGLPYRKGFRRTEHFRLFKGDGLENEKVQTTSKKASRKSRAKPDQAIDWDSDDLADFDDLSTTDEEVEEVDQVLRHRTRTSGAQYLVIGNGLGASDAKWMLHTRLISKSAVSEIKIYEEIRQMNIEEGDLDSESESDGDSDEEALQDLLDNMESEDDENARILRYTSRMTDEQIARALAKQEELGLGSDELMIFDGEAANGIETPDETFEFQGDFIPFSLSKHTSNRGRSKRNKKQRDSFPSAEAFADALDQDPYGAFDIMDFERPSLRPKKKGRKSDYPFDLEGLEDDDLKDQLINTWTKDREKKAERKRQREEARLTASLDAADGGDPDIIKTRIRQFLVQEIDVLKLSPMESHVRAGVHRLAKSLKLNSRSEGKEGLGLGRYPVLTKTPYTPHYTIQTIWQIDELMNQRKFFPKQLHKRPKGARASGIPKPRRGGGGGVMSGATYRDGEEVAASAPEIGADNRGRAMLEKMGWVQGTGIGAVGNKGGLDPIRHIVKTTKAGLG